MLEDTKQTLAIADASKPAIATLKLAELLHTEKFETIINQSKKLDLGLKPISKIVASAYLGKALSFLKKDDNHFRNNFDKAIALEPNFYQAYAKVGNKLTLCSKKEDLEQAKHYFEKCFSIKSNLKDNNIIGNFAIVLSKLASSDKSEVLFNQAFEQYEKSLKIQPDHANNLGNYATALYSLGKLKEDENLFNKAFEQYEKSLKIQPDHANNLGNYATALYSLGKLKEDENLFDKAFEKLKKALKIQPNKTYNLACYYTLINELDLSKENLLHAEQHDTLPYNSYNYLTKDTDLDNVRNEPWFIELLERLKAKEELTAKAS